MLTIKILDVRFNLLKLLSGLFQFFFNSDTSKWHFSTTS